jgi:hypothetical protein
VIAPCKSGALYLALVGREMSSTRSFSGALAERGGVGGGGFAPRPQVFVLYREEGGGGGRNLRIKKRRRFLFTSTQTYTHQQQQHQQQPDVPAPIHHCGEATTRSSNVETFVVRQTNTFFPLTRAERPSSMAPSSFRLSA